MKTMLIASLTLALGAASALAAAPAAPAAAKPAAKAPAKKKAATAPGAAKSDGFKTEDERTFYAYGFRVGQNLASTTPNDAEATAISKGLRDAITGKPEAVSMAIYLPKVSELASKRLAAKAGIMKAKGQAFADAFAKEDGVKPIAGGGLIKTLTEGAGDFPSADDTVKVNYRGTLTDGTEFDSSYKRNEPTSFPLRNVIPCWTNGVAMMKAGGKAKLVCPSEVAYGDQGHPPVIPGGSTLIFEIELLEITKAVPAETPIKPAGKK